MNLRLATIALLIVIAVAGVGVYRTTTSQAEARRYRRKLESVGRAYQSLAQTYNEVVKKTAVTELLVEDGRVCIIVRNASGVVQKLATPFDPSGEIYVDYIVANGRLWIRRVYDEKTPPGEGMVVDASLAQINWQSAPQTYGKAVYRSLSDGRWIVTVTGDGSLGLAKYDGPTELTTSPPIRTYEQLQADDDPAAAISKSGQTLSKIVGADP